MFWSEDCGGRCPDIAVSSGRLWGHGAQTGTIEQEVMVMLERRRGGTHRTGEQMTQMTTTRSNRIWHHLHPVHTDPWKNRAKTVKRFLLRTCWVYWRSRRRGRSVWSARTVPKQWCCCHVDISVCVKVVQPFCWGNLSTNRTAHCAGTWSSTLWTCICESVSCFSLVKFETVYLLNKCTKQIRNATRTIYKLYNKLLNILCAVATAVTRDAFWCCNVYQHICLKLKYLLAESSCEEGTEQCLVCQKFSTRMFFVQQYFYLVVEAL